MEAKKQVFDQNWEPITETGCWIWTGPVKAGRNNEIRGRIMIHGERMFAHRWSWVIHRGRITDGLQVNHHCDQTLCVNPDHLYLGTQKENMRDAARRHRWPDRSGENNVKAKLTEDDARFIRESKKTAKELAELYGVTATTIYFVRSGKCWGRANA